MIPSRYEHQLQWKTPCACIAELHLLQKAHKQIQQLSAHHGLHGSTAQVLTTLQQLAQKFGLLETQVSGCSRQASRYDNSYALLCMGTGCP